GDRDESMCLHSFSLLGAQCAVRRGGKPRFRLVSAGRAVNLSALRTAHPSLQSTYPYVSLIYSLSGPHPAKTAGRVGSRGSGAPRWLDGGGRYFITVILFEDVFIWVLPFCCHLTIN